MPRTTEARTIASVTKTSGSAAVTAAAGSFDKSDVGRSITGTGIAGGTTLSAVASSTAATLSANATASNTAAATIGAVSDGSLGFTGWSPESGDEALTYTVAAVNSGAVQPDRVTSDKQQSPIFNRKVR